MTCNSVRELVAIMAEGKRFSKKRVPLRTEMWSWGGGRGAGQVHRGVPAVPVAYGAVGLGFAGRFVMRAPGRPVMDKCYAVLARKLPEVDWSGQMGRYLCTNLFGAGTLRTYCKLRFLVGFLRGLSHDLRGNPAQLDPLQRRGFTRRAVGKNAVKISGCHTLLSTTSNLRLPRNSTREVYVSQKPKVVSFVDCLRHPTSAIPSLLSSYLSAGPWAQSSHTATQATAPPQAGFKRKVELNKSFNHNLHEIGVVPLQVLKLLEAETGRPIHQLFDYICGVSTGAVLAFMLGLARFSLEECEDMYRRFGADVFRQNPLVGTVKMGWNHSYYNTETWETILREKMGEEILIRTSRDELSPKVSAVSAVVNWGNTPKAFVFRNYNHTPGSLSRYAGSSVYQMWQAVRASSAAPGYFQEFPLRSDIHQDGGIILNNPCALAVHESRLLWPKQPFQCVLSLGTGRYDAARRGPATSTSWRAKISNLICSATDTEGVHTLLDDLLAPDVYFRFNPMLSAEVSLDESRPGALDRLRRDTHVYLDRNRLKLARLCLVLGAERSAASHTKDWICERAWEVKQGWV
ncbi:unnamed protein product [Merluccius merluccius]